MNIYFNYDIKFKFGKLYIHYSIYGASFLLGVVMLALLDMIDFPLSDFHKALLTIPVRFLMNFSLSTGTCEVDRPAGEDDPRSRKLLTTGRTEPGCDLDGMRSTGVIRSFIV